jgi:hypothetical protein
MTYDPLYFTAPADSPGLDAFSRQRVSEPTLLIDLKRVGGVPDLFASNAVSGSGVAAYQINRASTYLTVGAAVGTAVRQSKSRAVYQPGKGLLHFQTFVLAPGEANLRQRCGYFDPKNGIFLELNGTTLNIVRRTYVTGAAVDTPVAQAAWNIDKLNGSGPSGLTLDPTKPQILVLDLQYLGVGRVRCYFDIGGKLIPFHQFLNANATLTSVYMANPNLPIRWEIEATGAIAATATLEAICASVNSEGGYEITGVTATQDMGATVEQIPGAGFEEILAIRMKSSFTEFATAFLQRASVLAASTSNFLARIVLNPTETVAGAWVDVNTNGSIMEYNLGRTVTENTGLELSAIYGSALVNGAGLDEKPVVTLGTTLAGVTDVYSLQIRNLGGGNEDYLGSLTWREIF